ncbi:MAG TPA: VOC family protein [Vicinamibacterales bacterium]|nr:VOC family protein [Vicinamibacterales bacterium]
METTIATLLKEFEDGKMTRRQLIQSLAVLATAGSAAAQTSTASRAPWKTVWLDHISYAVTDYKKSVEFYKNLMGWEVQNDNGKNQASMRIGSVGEIIIRNRRAPAAGAPARPEPTGVINHISYGIEPWDTDKVKAELERRGLNPRPDMQGENFKSFHVLDPDGWDLQISNQTKLG